MQSLLIAAEQKTFNKGKGKELSIVKAEQNELLTQWAEFFVRRLRQTESPGWDGIPPEFYLSFWPEQGPHLLVMSSDYFFTLRWVKIFITNVCSNWRPISLINGDIKLYTKVLARRLETTLPVLVHPDQKGFVKPRLSSDNRWRLVHIVHSAP